MLSLSLVSYIAAFCCGTLSIVFLARVYGDFVHRNERLWTIVSRSNDNWLDTFIAFLKQLLVTRGLEFRSVEKMYAQLKKDLIRANYAESAEEYLGSTLFEGVMVLTIGAMMCLFLFGITSLVIPVALALLWSLWMRPSLVAADGEKRSRAVYRRIPYALDLSVLVLETGGTLVEALEVIAVHDDPLAHEFRTALKEMDSGASQAAALKNMSDRVGLEPLETIVMAINRGSETGAPMAQTMKTQAVLFRERRLAEVEKLAVEAPTKMTFPNMMVMLSVLLIIIGPLIEKMASSGLL